MRIMVRYTNYKYSRLATSLDYLINSPMTYIVMMFIYVGIILIYLKTNNILYADLPDYMTLIMLGFIIIGTWIIRFCSKKFKWTSKLHTKRTNQKIIHNLDFAKKMYHESPETLHYILSFRPNFLNDIQ